MTEFILYGSGWRAECFIRIVQQLENFRISAVITRNPQKIKEYRKQGLTCVANIEEALKFDKPHFVLLCINREYHAKVILEIQKYQLPILCETPIVATEAELAELLSSEASSLIQVAEQYPYRPEQAAQIALINSGILGEVQLAQISLTNNYHAISLMKKFLQTKGFVDQLQAIAFPVKNRSGFERLGDTQGANEIINQQILAVLDFQGKIGLYNFEDNQHRSFTRFSLIEVKGERGELFNRQVKYLSEQNIPLEGEILRIERGVNENMEGSGLKGFQFAGQWLYKNPFPNLAFSDDDIATATVLEKMRRFVKDQLSFYSLQEAGEDFLLTLAIEDALKKNSYYFYFPVL